LIEGARGAGFPTPLNLRVFKIDWKRVRKLPLFLCASFANEADILHVYRKRRPRLLPKFTALAVLEIFILKRMHLRRFEVMELTDF